MQSEEVPEVQAVLQTPGEAVVSLQKVVVEHIVLVAAPQAQEFKKFETHEERQFPEEAE